MKPCHLGESSGAAFSIFLWTDSKKCAYNLYGAYQRQGETFHQRIRGDYAMNVIDWFVDNVTDAVGYFGDIINDIFNFFFGWIF